MNSVHFTSCLLFVLLIQACASESGRYQDNTKLERPPEIPVDKQAAEQIAANELTAPIRRHGKGLKSDVYPVEGTTAAFKIKRNFDEAWSLLLQAIQHNELKVADQDRSKGNFYLAYNGGSLLSGAAAFFDKGRSQPTYLVKVEPEGEETKVTVSLASKDEQSNATGSKTSGDSSPEDKSPALLELLFDTLHDKVKDD